MPLLVLTADRPPELRAIGAGQTIDQLKLYGDAAKWFFEVGDARGHARAAALDPPAGLPRLPDGRVGPPRRRAPELRTARAARARRAAARGATTAPLPPRTPGAGAARDRPRPRSSARCIVAGPPRAPRRARRGAGHGRGRAGDAAAGRPALGRAPRPGGVAHYDALLRDAGFAAAHRPGPSSASATCRPPSRCASGWPASRPARSPSTPRAPGRTRPRVVAEVLDADPAAWARSMRRADRGRARGWRRGAPPTRPPRRASPRRSATRSASPRGARRWRRCRRATVTVFRPPRCRCATSRPSGPRATRRRACSPTAAPTASTAPSPRPSASPPPARASSCYLGDVALAHDLGAPAQRHAAEARAHDRARRQRRRRDLRLPPGRARRPTPSRSTSPRRPASTPSASPRSSACAYERVDDLAAIREAPGSAAARPHRSRGERRACIVACTKPSPSVSPASVARP